jgi:hypothetical protein
LVDFLHVLLLLVELVDELILVGDLIVQVTDLVILGCLVLLGLLGIQMRLLVLLFQYSSTSWNYYFLKGQFHVFNVLLESRSLLLEFLLVLEELVAGIFLLLESLLGVL